MQLHGGGLCRAGFWGNGIPEQGEVMLSCSHSLFPSSRRVYKEHLGLSQKVAIGYQAHADTATKSGSLTKTKFVV